MTRLRYALIGIAAVTALANAWTIPLDTGDNWQKSSELIPRNKGQPDGSPDSEGHRNYNYPNKPSEMTHKSRDDKSPDLQKAIAQGQMTYAIMNGSSSPDSANSNPDAKNLTALQQDLESQNWTDPTDPANENAKLIEMIWLKDNENYYSDVSKNCVAPLGIADHDIPPQGMTIYKNREALDRHWNFWMESTVWEFRNGSIPEELDSDFSSMTTLRYYTNFTGDKLQSVVECNLAKDSQGDLFDALKSGVDPPISGDLTFPGHSFKPGDDGFYALLGLSGGSLAGTLINNAGQIKSPDKCVSEIAFWESDSARANIWYKIAKGACGGNTVASKRSLHAGSGAGSSSKGKSKSSEFQVAVELGRAIHQTLIQEDSAGEPSKWTDPAKDLAKNGWTDVSNLPENEGGPKPLEDRPEYVENCIMPVGKKVSGMFDEHTLKIKKYLHKGPSGGSKSQSSLTQPFFENWYEKKMIFAMDNESPEHLKKQGHIKDDLPELRHWSDVAYLSYFKDPSLGGESPLEAIVQCGVMEDKAIEVFRTIREDAKLKVDKTIAFPGLKFTPQDEGYYALLGIPAGKGVGYLLAQNKPVIGAYDIKAIHLWTNEFRTVNIWFEIDQRRAGSGSKSVAKSGAKHRLKVGEHSGGPSRPGGSSKHVARAGDVRVSSRQTKERPVSSGGHNQKQFTLEQAVAKGKGLYKEMTKAGPGRARKWAEMTDSSITNNGWKPITPPPRLPDIDQALKDVAGELNIPTITPDEKSSFEQREYMYSGDHASGSATVNSSNAYGPGLLVLNNMNPSSGKKLKMTPWDISLFGYNQTMKSDPLRNIVDVAFKDTNFQSILKKLRVEHTLQFANKYVATPARNVDVFYASLALGHGPDIVSLLNGYRKTLGHLCVKDVNIWFEEAKRPIVWYKLDPCGGDDQNGVADMSTKHTVLGGHMRLPIMNRPHVHTTGSGNDAHIDKRAKTITAKFAVKKGQGLYKQMTAPGAGTPRKWSQISPKDAKKYGWTLKTPRASADMLKVATVVAHTIKMPVADMKKLKHRRYNSGAAHSDTLSGPEMIIVDNYDPSNSKKRKMNPWDLTQFSYLQGFKSTPLKDIVSIADNDPAFKHMLEELGVKSSPDFKHKFVATPTKNAKVFYAALGAGDGPEISSMLNGYRETLGHLCVAAVAIWHQNGGLVVWYTLDECDKVNSSGSATTSEKHAEHGGILSDGQHGGHSKRPNEE